MDLWCCGVALVLQLHSGFVVALWFCSYQQVLLWFLCCGVALVFQLHSGVIVALGICSYTQVLLWHSGVVGLLWFSVTLQCCCGTWVM